MAIQIRPDYINPFAMMADKKTARQIGQLTVRKGEPADKITELETKQQQLQNQMLLLKATGTDSAGATAETQKVVQTELEKVTAELRTAKGNDAQTIEETEQTHLDAQPIKIRHNMDLYESEKTKTASPGIYQIKEDSEKGYKVLFLPYSEN